MPKGLLRSGVTAAFDQALWQALQITPEEAWVLDNTIQPSLLLGLKKGSQGTPGLPAAISVEKDDDGNIVLLTKVVNKSWLTEAEITARYLKLDGSNANADVDIGTYKYIARQASFADDTPTTLRGNVYNNYANDARGFLHQFEKIRGINAVQDNDAIGNLFFKGWDGTGYQWSAAITARVMGAVSAGNVPIDLEFSTGTSSFGVVNLILDHDANLSGQKFRITKDGGYAIKLTNRTGSTSVQGEVVRPSNVANSVRLTAANDLGAIGVFEATGIAHNAEAWIVTGGMAIVKADGAGWAIADRIVTSLSGGRGAANNAPSVAIHFQEIGHAIEAAAGNGTGRVVLHFL